MKARVVQSIDFDGLPGDVEYMTGARGEVSSMLFCCPNCAQLSVIGLRGENKEPYWNRNEQFPTVWLPLHHNNGKCGWKGQLTGGIFIPS